VQKTFPTFRQAGKPNDMMLYSYEFVVGKRLS
jgi:hypothetical protein